jgi:diguanylate cyclase (GGDEF)-like protein
MGLRLKLGLYVVVFVGTTLALVGWLRARAERQIFIEQMETRGVVLLRAFAIPCGIALANNDTPTLDNYVEQFSEAAAVMDLGYMAVLGFEGRVIAHTRSEEFGKTYNDPFTLKALAADAPLTQLTTVGDEAMLEVAVPVVSGLRWGTIKAGFTLGKLERDLRERELQLLYVGIAISIGAAILAYFILSFLVVRPVFRLTQMAKLFGGGKLDARVQLDQKDEMGELAHQMNGMAEQLQRYTTSLEKLVDERTRALADSNEKLLSANKQLERMARTDALTGLYNRRHFMEQLQFEIRRGQRNPHEFTIIMLDVDHFKNYNDSNGHTAGDELLQRLAALLEINLRATDVIARYGGEEFIILLLDTGPIEGFATAQKLQQVVEAQPMPFEEKQPNGQLTVSVGVAFYPGDGQDAMTLIDHADRALYASKGRGRNCVTRWIDIAQAQAS